MSGTISWQSVEGWLRAQPEGTMLRIPKSQIQHPVDGGAQRTIGLPVGQSADYRWADLFVQEFPHCYEAHVGKADAGAIARPVDDERQSLVDSSIAIGALLGALIGGSRASTEVGAGLGALFGVMTSQDSPGPAAEDALRARKGTRHAKPDSAPRPKGARTPQAESAGTKKKKKKKKTTREKAKTEKKKSTKRTRGHAPDLKSQKPQRKPDGRGARKRSGSGG